MIKFEIEIKEKENGNVGIEFSILEKMLQVKKDLIVMCC